MTAGISPEIALNLDQEERIAFCVIIGEQNGGTFDWQKRDWVKQK